MRIKKNTGAKIAALLASLTALGGVWALVHQNPPANAGGSATAAAPTSTPPARGIAPARAAANTGDQEAHEDARLLT